MRARLHALTDLLANVAVVVVGILAAILLARQLWFPPAASAHRQPRPTLDGTTLTIPGADWSGSEQNVVLFLSATCRFCSDSAPFYRRLAGKLRTSRSARLIAVFPQGQDEARSYLTSHSVGVDTVLSVGATVGPRTGTPTVLIVDRHGRVDASWVGKLDTKGEEAVIARIR